MAELNADRYSRNVALFGAEGQRRLEKVQVAIVGLGGLGSHVGQQLAYLGVHKFVLVDPDTVDASNLNRLIGALSADVGVKKVNVASRLICGIQPGATIEAVDSLIDDPDAIPAIVRAQYVFGCVDNDGARLALTELTSRHKIPYIDLASDAGQHNGTSWYGGRVFVARDGAQCLSCAGELDQGALALSSLAPAQRAADERIYGIDRRHLGEAGPMVVSINGTVASLAVTEFVVWVTGLRPPSAHLSYRGDLGTVTVRHDDRVGSCYYCDVLWHAAD